MYPPNTNKKFHPTPAHLAVLSYVLQNPGCNKWHAAKAGTRNAARSPHKQYYLVNTLINQKYLLAEKVGNEYQLYHWTTISPIPPMVVNLQNLIKRS